MSDQNMNFNESNFDAASSINNYYMFSDNISSCSHQPQNSSQFVPSGMFSVPPPPVFPNYLQMPPPPAPLPPPQFSLPPLNLSIPPPPMPSEFHPEKGMLCSESSYRESEIDTGDQHYFPSPFQEISNQVQSFHHSASNVNHLQGFNVPSQQLNNFLITQDINKSEDKIDEYWVKNWLKEIRKFKEKDGHIEIYEKSLPLSSSLSSELKINEAKKNVIHVSKLLAELENACKSLSVIYKSLSNNEWLLRCSEIEEKKKMLADLLGQFVNNEKFILSIKKKLTKRIKKRERQKRRREDWKQQKIESSLKRQQLQQNIDRWLEDMKDSVERGKRDEELKREADSVLAEVTRRKVEAKKQIALLSALLKLREVRCTAQKAIGKNISQQQTDAFNSVIERLKTLWEKQMKEYSLEEQGLKVMLNEAAAEEKNNEALRKKEILRDWELALFGDLKTDEYKRKDIGEFISIRKQWDKFVVDEGTVVSSSIPPGWVIPTKASDLSWTKFNKASTT